MITDTFCLVDICLGNTLQITLTLSRAYYSVSQISDILQHSQNRRKMEKTPEYNNPDSKRKLDKSKS